LGFFSYYAFDGLTGRLRWKHEAGDFEEARPSKEDFVRLQQLIFSHEFDFKLFLCRCFLSVVFGATQRSRQNSKFDVNELAYQMHGLMPERGVARQLGELDARHYTRTLQPLLRAHGVWRAPLDTRLATAYVNLRAESAAADTASSPSSSRNVLIARHSTGLEVVHLFSGRPLFRIPLDAGLSLSVCSRIHSTTASGRVYDDVNADARIDSVALLKVKNHNIKFVDERDARRWQRRLERHAAQRFDIILPSK
jgi:hypothetical protein